MVPPSRRRIAQSREAATGATHLARLPIPWPRRSVAQLFPVGPAVELLQRRSQQPYGSLSESQSSVVVLNERGWLGCRLVHAIRNTPDHAVIVEPHEDVARLVKGRPGFRKADAIPPTRLPGTGWRTPSRCASSTTARAATRCSRERRKRPAARSSSIRRWAKRMPRWD